ncbi:MAG TPA: hypothetical protein VNJ29_02415 [Candidatus Nitrosotenuis sp.]|nr:hypothetical protein [Candidatus Nitrosotenuis sp.]
MDHDIFLKAGAVQSKNELLESTFKYPNLLAETFKLVSEKLKGQENRVTNQQVLTCIEEIFLHSLQKDMEQVDEKFAD